MKLVHFAPSSAVASADINEQTRSGGFQTEIYRNYGKRIFDISLVLIAAPVVLPVMAILVVLVALGGSKPFYSQERVGRNGRLFKMWKLRTMVPDAEKRLKEYLEGNSDAQAEWNSKQKLALDPRITSIGFVLRKSSLDELPQLWNVLLGEMSLVGPRPMMPCQRTLYPGNTHFRSRPGITGAWQISERNQTSFAARAKYDTEYDTLLSFSCDVGILAKTVGVVLRAKGC